MDYNTLSAHQSYKENTLSPFYRSRNKAVKLNNSPGPSMVVKLNFEPGQADSWTWVVTTAINYIVISVYLMGK